ncbi:extracellular solute-binding protein, family 5 Middle [Ruegeria halocynthiae]|uniref:Extracellular solute-binding protein, family 5 Middle n=1 Tax=Ruegeria halocynthiae TaxID=985054 RepID=A0A1H3DUD9_9RHOB|nr:ABC transporter substrate-binding protein [Ruegeria halocynthiae]SDX70142.1 extracellular solute-binding protein, family 5 Middle [Ruegeria halocynthiae]
MTRIDRRALFASGAAAALLTATGGSLADTPKTGGKLRLAVPRDDSLELLARGAVFDTLTEVAPDGTLRGELAVAWQTEEQARVWNFDLRGDAMFHDGIPLHVDDVVAVLAEIGRVEALAPDRVRLELVEANPGLPFLLADSRFVVTRGGQGVTPLHRASGTGCYRVERANDSHHFLGRRVAGHYKDGQAGWVDALEIIVIPDARVRAEALRDGYVDIAALPESDELKGQRGLRYHPGETDVMLAVAAHVGMPRQIGKGGALDDGRIAERWWLA